MSIHLLCALEAAKHLEELPLIFLRNASSCIKDSDDNFFPSLWPESLLFLFKVMLSSGLLAANWNLIVMYVIIIKEAVLFIIQLLMGSVFLDQFRRILRFYVINFYLYGAT